MKFSSSIWLLCCLMIIISHHQKSMIWFFTYFFFYHQVGNAVTDDYHDYVGTFEYWWTHGLISDSTYKMLQFTCDFGSSEHPSTQCNESLNVAVLEQGNIDPYSIYTRPCSDTASLKRNLRGRYVSSIINSFRFTSLKKLKSIYNTSSSA